MRFLFALCIAILFHIQPVCHGQEIGPLTSHKQWTSNRQICFSYENDFFGSSDKYYTQGINLGIMHPILKSNPINFILISPKSYQNLYGLFVEHNIFTPSDIRATGLPNHNRPYAGCLILKSYLVTSNNEKGVYITSSLIAGVIGHMANGDCLQIYYHKWTNDIRQPQGWDYQVKNDLILNYQINYERELYSISNLITIYGCAEIKTGTLHDRLGMGFSILAGNFSTLVETINLSGLNKLSKRYEPVSLDLFVNPYIHLVGYNATMQGGVFQRDNPYIVSNKDMERILISSRFGIVLKVRNVCVEYFHEILSKEFKSGLMHRWGGIKLAIGI